MPPLRGLDEPVAINISRLRRFDLWVQRARSDVAHWGPWRIGALGSVLTFDTELIIQVGLPK